MRGDPLNLIRVMPAKGWERGTCFRHTAFRQALLTEGQEAR